MAKIQSIFKRQEKKYLLSKNQYILFQSYIAPFIKPDKYPHYTICNLYFDTDDYRIIRDSIEKPIYKEKLRLRSYGQITADDSVFFELKKKFKGVVYKRRVAISLREYESFMKTGIFPDASKQIMNEIAWFLQTYHPMPKVYLSYNREAYHDKENKDLRITFDTDIQFRQNRLSLCEDTKGTPLLDSDTYLLEIKATGAFPLWLADALSKTELYPISFSKYGTIYKNYIFKSFGGFHYA